jgi:putative protease
MQLVCPAGNYPMLKAAVENGADAVYIGFRDDTNARHFAGLNFNDGSAQKAVRYAHDHGSKVYLAINTYPQPAGWQRWQRAVDVAAAIGIDALIIADIGVLAYAAENYPDRRITRICRATCRFRARRRIPRRYAFTRPSSTSAAPLFRACCR